MIFNSKKAIEEFNQKCPTGIGKDAKVSYELGLNRLSRYNKWLDEQIPCQECITRLTIRSEGCIKCDGKGTIANVERFLEK